MSPDITDELERLHAHGATASIYIEYKVALEKKCVELVAEVARLTELVDDVKERVQMWVDTDDADPFEVLIHLMNALGIPHEKGEQPAAAPQPGHEMCGKVVSGFVVKPTCGCQKPTATPHFSGEGNLRVVGHSHEWHGCADTAAPLPDTPEWRKWRDDNDASCDNCATIAICPLHAHGNPYNLCRDWEPVTAAPNAPMTHENPLDGSDSQVADVKGLGKAAAGEVCECGHGPGSHIKRTGLCIHGEGPDECACEEYKERGSG